MNQSEIKENVSNSHICCQTSQNTQDDNVCRRIHSLKRRERERENEY